MPRELNAKAVNSTSTPSDTDRKIARFLLQLEIDTLAAYLDESVRDETVSCEEVAVAAMRYANLLVQLKVMQDRAAILMAGSRGYA